MALLSKSYRKAELTQGESFTLDPSQFDKSGAFFWNESIFQESGGKTTFVRGETDQLTVLIAC